MWVQDTTLIMPHTTRHAELVSASHCEPCLVLVLGEIQKQVQDDEMRPCKQPVILNLFQDLTASLHYPFSADRY